MNIKRKISVLFSAILLTITVFSSSLTHAANDIETVSAVVESVLLAKQSIKIMHDPVEAWGWPKMKMKFAVAPDVDLKLFSEGQMVMVTLKKDGMMAMIIAIELVN